MSVTTVFFDVGNTLIRPAVSEFAVLVDSAKSLGVTIDPRFSQQSAFEIMTKHDQLFQPDNALWASQEKAVALYMSIFQHMCEAAGVSQHTERIAELSYKKLLNPSTWMLFDDAAETLDTLKAQGLKMGLISNWDRSLETIIQGLRLDHYFDVVISSAAVGFYKPQQEIFKLALNETGTRPEQAMHVGDNVNADIGGAKNVGITPVLIDRTKLHTVDESVVHVSKLTDLLNYL